MTGFEGTLEFCPVKMEALLRERLGGRVHGFRLLIREEGMILQGRSATYYGKQLAQHFAMTMTGLPVFANTIQVRPRPVDAREACVGD